MITDEQRKTFENWFRSMYGSDSRMLRMRENPDIYDWLGHQVPWQAWQAAQQIKPLEFEIDDDDDLVARTAFGWVIIILRKGSYIYNGTDYKTEAKAIEAANEDYQRKVLSCLVNGGSQ